MSMTRRQAATRPVRPVWDSAFRNPVADGHVRLRGLSWTERQAARFGLVALALLLVSLLFSDVWRRGEMLPIGDGDALTFLPVGLLPVTLLCFVGAWVMLTWGALTAAWPIRIVVAAMFLLTNPALAIPASIDIGDHPAFEWGNDLVATGYFAAPGLLVLSIGLRWLPPRVGARALPVFRLLIVAALTLFFLTHLWVHLAFSDEGFPAIVQQQVSGAILEIDSLLGPLVYVSAILVIDFGLNMSLGVAESVRQTPLKVARWLLVALIAVKLWFVLFDDLDAWLTLVADRPGAVVRTLVSIVVLIAMALWVSRLPQSEHVDVAKERMLYATTFMFGLPAIIGILVIGLGVFVIAQFDGQEVPHFVTAYPQEAVPDWGFPLMSGLAIAVGIWLLRRRRTALDSELGSGLLCIGVWALPSFLINQTDWEIGFDDKLVDLGATVAVVAVLVVSWRRLTPAMVMALSAVTMFTWLAMTRGDWIALIGSWFALPATLITIVGITMSVAGDASFTAKDGRVVPQGSRVLLFVGYILLTVTILHWVETTHASSLREVFSSASFYFIGIPWAAWVAGRKLLPLADDIPAPVEPEEPLRVPEAAL